MTRAGMWARVSRDLHFDGIALHLVQYKRTPEGQSVGMVATEVVMEEMAQGAFFPEPSVRLSQEAAVQLMDEMWRTGIRPTEEGTIGQLNAVEGHRDHLTKLLDQVLPHAMRAGYDA